MSNWCKYCLQPELIIYNNSSFCENSLVQKNIFARGIPIMYLASGCTVVHDRVLTRNKYAYCAIVICFVLII